MSKATRAKKIAHFLFLAGRSDKIRQMREDIKNCDSKLERDYVEDHYKKYYKPCEQACESVENYFLSK